MGAGALHMGVPPSCRAVGLARALRCRRSMRDRIVEELASIRGIPGVERVVWIRAAAGAVVADVISDDRTRAPSLEGHVLGPSVARPRPRWVECLVNAELVLGETPLLLRWIGDPESSSARVIASERRVFGVLVVVGARRRGIAPRVVAELERAVARVGAQLQATIEAAEARKAARLVWGEEGELIFAGEGAESWLNDLAGAPLTPGIVRGVRVEAEVLEGSGGRAQLLTLSAAPPLWRAPDASLSDTQRVVAEYAGAGSTVPEIARSLAISRETVRTHLREIYRRLGVCSRVELVRALGAA
jgi:DNA-binding CsgD family transcriptional regulator